jgi:GT2 family glycosyltransferase
MNKIQPKVAVIVANYNGLSAEYNSEPILYTCLKGLKATKYANMEVIIADDSSTDGSLEYVKRHFDGIRLVSMPKNGGYSKNNNNAIRYAMRSYDPDYILLLNNDIVIKDSRWISKMVSLAEKDNSIGIVGCKLLYPNGKIQHAGVEIGMFPSNRGRGEKDIGQYDSIEELEGVTGAAMLIKKRVIKVIGLLDENFYMGYEDVDYCIMARKAGFRIIYDGKVKLTHLEGFTSTNSKNSDLRDRMFYYQVRNYTYLALKNFGLIKKVIGIAAFTFVGSLITIEGRDRIRGIGGLRFKNNMLGNLAAAFKAVKASIKLYNMHKNSIKK